MTRAVRFICCVALLWCYTLPLSAQQFRAQESNPVSVTATIEAVDTTNRTVTVKRTDGTSAEIKAPKEMLRSRSFDDAQAWRPGAARRAVDDD